jgi:hypothetical protein
VLLSQDGGAFLAWAEDGDPHGMSGQIGDVSPFPVQWLLASGSVAMAAAGPVITALLADLTDSRA